MLNKLYTKPFDHVSAHLESPAWVNKSDQKLEIVHKKLKILLLKFIFYDMHWNFLCKFDWTDLFQEWKMYNYLALSKNK